MQTYEKRSEDWKRNSKAIKEEFGGMDARGSMVVSHDDASGTPLGWSMSLTVGAAR